MTDEVRNSIPQGFEQAVDIPRDQWSNFLTGFSSENIKRTATVEVVGSDGDRDIEIRECPFTGASLDQPGSGEIRMFIGMADDEPSSQIMHSVMNPARVALASPNSDDLLIQSEDGTITLIRFTDRKKPTDIAA